MATRKQSSFDGQNGDSGGEHDKLVSIGANQTNPYNAKASDWPDGKTPVDAEHGQGGGATHENPKAGGYDMLVSQTKTQEGPRHTEDGMSSMNDSMDEKKNAVAMNFKTDKNMGESEGKPMSPGMDESIDLLTGKIMCSSYKPSRVGEVAECGVKLG